MLSHQEASEERKNDGAKHISKECSGVSHTFRVSLFVEGTSQSGGQLLNLQHQMQEEIETLRVFVNPCFKMQHSSNLMPLLNLCNLFEQKARKSELLELEIMTAQALIAARKFIQAIEKLRKI